MEKKNKKTVECKNVFCVNGCLRPVHTKDYNGKSKILISILILREYGNPQNSYK